MSTTVRSPIHLSRRRLVGAAAAVGLLTAVALAGPGEASFAIGVPPASKPAPPATCHEFVRFRERWELCTGPNGLESHRLGVYSAAPA
jgi:hypothetical protein